MCFSESRQFIRVLGDSAELTDVSEHFRQQNRVKWQLTGMHSLTTNVYVVYKTLSF